MLPVSTQRGLATEQCEAEKSGLRCNRSFANTSSNIQPLAGAGSVWSIASLQHKPTCCDISWEGWTG